MQRLLTAAKAGQACASAYVCWGLRMAYQPPGNNSAVNTVQLKPGNMENLCASSLRIFLRCLQISSIMVAASPLEAPQQLTIAGRPCQFPFFYRGVAHSSCVAYTSADSSSFCMDVDGRFAMCSPAPVSPYSTFQTWLDQWAGRGALQTAVRLTFIPVQTSRQRITYASAVDERFAVC